MSTPDAAVHQRLEQVRPIIDAAFAGMTQELTRLGMGEDVTWLPADAAAYKMVTDPADGGQSLVGIWRDEGGGHLGDLVVHADNSFYIEYGVCIPHPSKSGWLVDAIIAWGRDGVVKAEPRLLPPL